MRLLAATVVLVCLMACAGGTGAAAAQRTCGALRDDGIARLRADGTGCSAARHVARAWDERCTSRATSAVRSPCSVLRYRCRARRSQFLTAAVTCTRATREVRFTKAFLGRMTSG